MSHEWMRQEHVDILQYLPAFLQSDELFKATNDADSKEHDSIRVSMQEVLDQCFVRTATWGLDLWEELVGLPISKSKDYALRRADVLARLHASYSVTLEFIYQLIDKYIVNHQFRLREVPEDYRIEIEIQDGKVLSWGALELALRIWIPAHIGWKINARTEVNGGIYFGGVVSVFDEIHIGAQTGYKLGDIAPAKIIPVGVVQVADSIHIGADIYS